ncbi:MAG: sigma-54 dependent transcriptional regulator [Desulfovibrio sp.]|jgi:DNA-binding NtrC family response regulator|nr:sigma-54 dependent transcriptional regulator [Desulfovibrio sp.]
MDNKNILVVEDEDIAREYVADILRDNGFNAFEAATGEEAVLALARQSFALVISDIRMPDMGGLRLLKHIKSAHPTTEVIMVTGYASIEDAVDAVKMGAYQYLAKPLRLNEMLIMVERALEKRRTQVELHELRRSLHNADAPKIIGNSAAVSQLKNNIRQIAATDCTVLLLGETGTGKDLVARSLHAHSARSGGRFLAINCASFTEDLLTRELFGHEKSAFTGAYNTQKGLLESAAGGTFFLDEVGDMSLSMQAAMLRVLESRTLFRVGGTKEIPVDTRIIAATNKDLKQMVAGGAFRQDLFYRLNVMPLIVPPLAARKEDIPLLAAYFIARNQADRDKAVKGLDDKAIDLLMSYDFPGNVRELEYMIERAMILCRSELIGVSDLPRELRGRSAAPEAESEAASELISLEENERRYLARVIKEAGGSTSKAAALLGLNRGSLWRKLKRLGLADQAGQL